MNTVTQSETLALSAVAAAAAVSSAAMTGESVTVPEVAPYELHLIPLSRLRPSSRNVRQSGGTAIPELAASIARVGLLQNLTVITSPDEQWFEVVAGRRRLAALKLLVKRHKLDKDHLVQCRSVKSERHFFDGILGLGHTNLTRIPPVGSARRQHEAADVLSHGRKLGRDGPRGV